jgi:U3 small nucleolar RNA-associated protein 18
MPPDPEELELQSMLFGDIAKSSSSSHLSDPTDPKSESFVSAGEQQQKLFWVDHGNSGSNRNDDDNDDDNNSKSKKSKKSKRAWTDHADAALQVNLAAVNRTRKLRKTQQEDVVSGTDYQQRLREQFNRANAHTGVNSWASSKKNSSNPNDSDSDSNSISEDDNNSSDPLRSTASVLSGDIGGPLPASELRVLRLKDANATSPSSCAIQSVQFMRRSSSGTSSTSSSSSSSSSSFTPLLLTAGFDKTLRLFSIDGKSNKKVQSVFVRDFPIHHAEFSPASDEIVLGGRRSFFYVYDMQAARVNKIPTIVGREEKSLEKFTMSPDGKYITFLGNDGYAIMVDRKTKRWLFDLKMNGAIRSCSYSSDGNNMYTSGTDGHIYNWDLRTRKCVDRHLDEGCIRSTSLAVSPSTGMYACGGDNGCVNLYRTSLGDSNRILSNNNPLFDNRKKKFRGPLAASLKLLRSPYKSIMSLTTRADTLRYNHDGQILAIASQMKKDSLRLVHAQTGTIFANWPTAQTPLRYVTDVDFSPNSGMIAIGNDRGRCLLYRLLHYSKA